MVKIHNMIRDENWSQTTCMTKQTITHGYFQHAPFNTDMSDNARTFTTSCLLCLMSHSMKQL